MRVKNRKFRKSQVVFEYVVIFAIVIAAIASIGFISKIKDSFSRHKDKCVDIILEKG